MLQNSPYPHRAAGCFFSLIVFVLSTTACATLPAPTLLSPENGRHGVSLNPRLEWRFSDGPADFELELNEKTDAGETLLFRERVSAPFFEIPPERLQGLSSYRWRVRAVSGADESGEWSDTWMFSTQPTPGNPWEALEDGDTDQDGIPDRIEKETYHTDPFRKTLFVRPKKKIDAQTDAYWEEFYTRLFPGSTNGTALIPAFEAANVEVVVLGAPDHPFSLFRGAAGYEYDPDNHPEWPCDILEIILKPPGSKEYPIYIFGADDEAHKGHIYFREYAMADGDSVTLTGTWTWSTKGYTSSSEKSYKYYQPYVYLHPLQCYFEEGAYPVIRMEAVPETMDCKDSPETDCVYSSPMNLNAQDPSPNPPYTLTGDDTVEINPLAFDENGRITEIGDAGTSYDIYQVMARTVVHEMGHALLGAVNEDHCDNPCCIMFRNSIDWEQKMFGPSCPATETRAPISGCSHSPGGSKDIRGLHVIYNFYRSGP